MPQGARPFGSLTDTSLWIQWRILHENYLGDRHPWAMARATACRPRPTCPNSAAVGGHNSQHPPTDPEQIHPTTHHTPRGQHQKQLLRRAHPHGKLWAQMRQSMPQGGHRMYIRTYRRELSESSHSSLWLKYFCAISLNFGESRASPIFSSNIFR